jgi:Pyridoxamine 5'-phosphate oxidase
VIGEPICRVTPELPLMQLCLFRHANTTSSALILPMARAYDATIAPPKRDRPHLPPGYITRAPTGLLSWASVERILRAAPYLWIATTADDGAPHLVQQWCAWVDQTLYFEGSDRTRWARNLARDPRLAFGVQVDDRSAYGQAVVDVVGGLKRSVATRIARQYAAKYGAPFGYRPSPEQYEKGPVFRARPTKIIAFDVRRFNTSATRFTFEAAENDGLPED